MHAAPQIRHVTAPDGYRLAVRHWQAETPAVQVVLLHGILSHGGWYAASCAQLAAEGVSVHLPDRRGAGLNLARRGDVEDYTTWITDVEALIGSLSPSLPTVLAGISWGGKLAAAVARRGRVSLAGLALLCPGLFARQNPSRWQRAAVALASGVGLGGLRVRIPLADPALFTADPQWQAFLRTDPLALRQVTLRFAAQDRRLTHFATAAPEAIRVPTLLVLAGQDGIVDNRATRRFATQISHQDTTVREYPEAGHTLQFEPDAARYTADLAAWCRSR